LALLRLIHLGADTPPELSGSAALYVDEGYKTLSPRNLVLFGATHWNPHDVYAGWMSGSPVTQWSYYASFRLFGTSVESARGVTVFYFALLLVGYVWAMAGRYRPALVLGGLAVLGLERTIFFLSRIAVFEMPIATLVAGLLFVFARMKPHRSVASVLAATATGVILALGVKLTSLFYLAPILLAASMFFVFAKRPPRRLIGWLSVTLAVVGFGALLFFFRSLWMLRMDLVPYDIGQRILENPLVRASPVIVLAGLLCAVHGLVCRPDLFLGSIYRISLVALVLLGVPLISLVDYDPLRYYAPLLPAFVLIVLEWIHLRGWTFSPPRPSLLAGLVTVAVMLAWVYFVCAEILDWRTFRLFLVMAPALAAVGVWTFRSLALRGSTVAAVLALMLPLFVVHDARSLGSFFLAPSYQAQTIRSELSRVIPEDSVLAGVWAPFIALGTSYKALYVAAVANPATSLPDLAPDYFLHTVGQRNSNSNLTAIQRDIEMSLASPVYTSEYNGRTVIVYPLLFDWHLISRRLFTVGTTLVEAGHAAEAESWFRRSLEARRRTGDLSLIAESQGELGACLVQLGRYAEAEELLLEAHRTIRPSGPAPSKSMARANLERIIALYDRWKKPLRAAEFRSLLEQPER
jgi:hypothetical protein